MGHDGERARYDAGGFGGSALRGAGVLVLVIAVLDFALPAASGAAVLYVLPVLLASRTLHGGALLALTATCSVLAVAAVIAAAPVAGADWYARAIVLLALWAVAALRLSEFRRERRRREWAAVASGSRDAIVAMALDGTVREWNARSEALYGYSAAQAIGRRADELLGAGDTTLLDAVRNLRDGGIEETFHDRHLTHAGEVLTVAITLSPVHDSSRTLIGVSASVRDVTLEMRAQAALSESEERYRTLSAELERQARQRDDFISMLGHELRNPLGAISNAAGVLRLAGAHTDRGERALEIIDNQVTTMRRQVDDMLDLARVDRGEFELKRAPVAVEEIVSMAVDSMAEHLGESGVTVALGPIEHGCMVYADKFRLAQVMHNLLDNAAKFTESEGTVTITTEADDDRVEIVVADEGIGIAPDLLPHVFEDFAQAEQHISRQSGGMGLGLAICRRIVDLHDGAITAESEGVAGRGTRVRVTLPCYDGTVPGAAVDTQVQEDAGGAARHVMVADDNVAALQALTDYLELNGFNVTQAIDGEGVLQALETAWPDVLVLDIGLPGRDGFEVAREVRARWPDRRCTLIAVTGYGSAQVAEQATAAGFDRYMVKPVSLEQLREALS